MADRPQEACRPFPPRVRAKEMQAMVEGAKIVRAELGRA
jgi:hypothetical protein